MNHTFYLKWGSISCWHKWMLWLSSWDYQEHSQSFWRKWSSSAQTQRQCSLFNLWYIQRAFEDVGHIYFCSPSYGPHLNVAQWISRHIKSHVRQNDLQKHRILLLHINDDVQAITANMIQGWISEVNRNFGKASRGEQLGESYTWCTVRCEIKLYNSWIDVVKL